MPEGPICWSESEKISESPTEIKVWLSIQQKKKKEMKFCPLVDILHQMMFSKGSLYLQVLVEADNSSGCEGQRQEVGEGEPEPELCEDQQADH